MTSQIWLIDLTGTKPPTMLGGYGELGLITVHNFMERAAADLVFRQDDTDLIANPIVDQVDTRHILRYEVRSKTTKALHYIIMYRLVEDETDAAMKLDGERQDAAETAFGEFEFERPVKGTGNWEDDGDTYTLPTFLEGEGDEPSTKVRFRCKFKPGTADVDEVYTD